MKRARPFAAQRQFGKQQPSQVSRTASMIAMLNSTDKPDLFTVDSLRRMYGADAKTAEYHLSVAMRRVSS
tara:strand:- start:19237 stop:19446 length:210 start_codon:yes stop_codon:yes gene_type:complete